MQTNFSGYDFHLMPPQALPQLAHIIYPGLTEVQRQAKKKGIDWPLMNVLKEIEINLSSLTMIYKDEEYAGFLVSKSIFAGLPNKHYYNPLVIFIEPKFRDVNGIAYNAVEDYVVELAYELKCHGIWCDAFRPGHVRRLEHRGYLLKQVTLIKEF